MRYTTQELLDRYNIDGKEWPARTLRLWMEAQGIEYKRYGQSRRTRWEIVE